MFSRLSLIIFILCFLSACNLNTTPATAVPTPDLPQVEILAPVNNQQVYMGTEFNFDIVGLDESVGIARIELYIDEIIINSASPLESDAVPVFRVAMNWVAQGEGIHVVEAIAYRTDGTRSDASIITIEVIPRDT